METKGKAERNQSSMRTKVLKEIGISTIKHTSHRRCHTENTGIREQTAGACLELLP